jgi:hypothetical protein
MRVEREVVDCAQVGWCFQEEAYRTILPWMAQEMQYWSFRYILGTAYSAKTEASEISPARVWLVVEFGRDQEQRGGARDCGKCLLNVGVRRNRRTDSSRLDHVADGESLHGLVLRNASRAVGAADGLDVATTLLVATAVQKLSARHPVFIHDQTNRTWKLSS